MTEIVCAERIDTGERVDVTIVALEAAGSQTTTTQHLRQQGDRVRLAGDILKRLRHPNVAAVLDAGEAPDGRPYFVTEELTDSSTVLEMLATNPLPLAEALSIALDVLSALEAAHEIGVLHRDVKPANVLIARAGKARVVKLTGFGVAKVVVENGNGPAPLMVPTAEGERIVPPRHISPEMMLGKTLDVRSDVYQVGFLLFEMIAGRPPFKTDGSANAWIASHVASSPLTLAGIDAAPVAVSEVVAKALAKRPECRWETAAEFIEALRACVVVYLDPEDRERLREVGAGGTDLIERSDLVSLMQKSGAPGDGAPTARLSPVKEPAEPSSSVPAEEAQTSPQPAPKSGSRDKMQLVMVAILIALVFALGWFAARWAG